MPLRRGRRRPSGDTLSGVTEAGPQFLPRVGEHATQGPVGGLQWTGIEQRADTTRRPAPRTPVAPRVPEGAARVPPPVLGREAAERPPQQPRLLALVLDQRLARAQAPSRSRSPRAPRPSRGDGSSAARREPGRATERCCGVDGDAVERLADPAVSDSARPGTCAASASADLWARTSAADEDLGIQVLGGSSRRRERAAQRRRQGSACGRKRVKFSQLQTCHRASPRQHRRVLRPEGSIGPVALDRRRCEVSNSVRVSVEPCERGAAAPKHTWPSACAAQAKPNRSSSTSSPLRAHVLDPGVRSATSRTRHGWPRPRPS